MSDPGLPTSGGLDPSAMVDPMVPDDERRFGGLRRLYGDAAYRRMRAASVAVVGLGGVGSWAVEALARSGVARLTLIDFDQVAESNIHRQVQALGRTVGMAKVDALAERVAEIHPGCTVQRVEAFATPDNWPALLPGPVDAVIDACDQSSAKLALATWALREQVPLVVCGAAGGKRRPQDVELADLADTTHDPLLAGLRQRLRRVQREAQGQGAAAHAGAPGRAPKAKDGRFGLACVFSREPVQPPADGAACAGDGSLNCHGYGSTVTVTATFGLVAAEAALQRVVAAKARWVGSPEGRGLAKVL